MPPTAVTVVVLVVVLDLVIVPLIIRALVRGAWSPIVERFPPREPGPDAVTRNFQSYKIGLLNLGYMLHTTVDDMCLHLRPARFGRMLGMKAASVPWEQITPVRRWGKRHAQVKIGANTFFGPRWALELAFADHDDDPSREETTDA